MSKGRPIVIAGNHFQYRMWLEHNGLKYKDVKYMDDVDKLYGIQRGTLCALVGTYWDNPVYNTDRMLDRALEFIYGDDDAQCQILKNYLHKLRLSSTEQAKPKSSQL